MWNPFRRQPVEQRSLDSAPWNYGGTSSSRAVSEVGALRLAPVFAAHRFLVDGISTLPLRQYRRLGDARQSTSYSQLFQFLAEQGTLIDWLSRLSSSLVIHGNAIGNITGRDGFEFPTQVDWRPKTEFHVDDNIPGRPVWYWNGRRIERSSIVHIPWLSVPGKTLGLSPLEYFMLTVNIGLKAQKYGEDWFDAGGVPPGKFKNSNKEVDPVKSAEIRARLVNAIRTHEPLVYGRDWDYDPLALPPEQAQFVQTQKMTADQIAGIYGIAPEEIGGEPAGSLTYTTEELRMIRRASDLRPWLERIEAALSALLPERQFVEFNTNAFIRADMKTRFEVYKISREIGVHNRDEIRDTEGLAPLPNGEGQDYTPLSVQSQAAAPPQQRAVERVNGHGWVLPDYRVEQIER